MEVFYVVLRNEGEGLPVIYDVAAEDKSAALAEAWRQYRELPYIDGEQPPRWTQAEVMPASRASHPEIAANGYQFYFPPPNPVEGR
jgi:hypothetical protein